MKIKKISMLSLGFALVFCVATGFITTSATRRNNLLQNGNVDSDFPIGSTTVMSNQQNNQGNGPRNEDSIPGELFAVNLGDESKFTPEEWEEILQKVADGEILLFDTLEDEMEYCRQQTEK